MLSINDMGQWCFGGDDNRWNFRSGYGVSHGILNYYRANNGILNLGVPRSDETSQMSGVAIQMFERGIVCYDPAHILDRPPGSGDVYLLHIDGGLGQQMIAQPLTGALQAQIVSLKAQLAQAQPAAVDALQGQIATLKARLTQIATLCQG